MSYTPPHIDHITLFHPLPLTSTIFSFPPPNPPTHLFFILSIEARWRVENFSQKGDRGGVAALFT
jgi:hypothetical protein